MSRRVRVRITGLSAMALEAIRSGLWQLVDDDSHDIHLVATQAGGAGVMPAGGAGSTPNPRVRRRVEAAAGLTDRELDVLEWLGRGASNAEIAQALYISRNTVKNHVRAILAKLEATSRTAAVVTAHQRGLLQL